MRLVIPNDVQHGLISHFMPCLSQSQKGSYFYPWSERQLWNSCSAQGSWELQLEFLRSQRSLCSLFRLCEAEWSCFAECNVAWKLAFTFYEPLIASVCEPSSNMETGSTGSYGLSDQFCLVLISSWMFPSICWEGSLDCDPDGFAQQRCFRKLKSIHGILWQQQKEFIYGL